jgi:pyruvate/2-oxoglutarate/acetoin dehydrogenase E1 component
MMPYIMPLHIQAIDHIINSAAKSNYMSAGQINVPIVFRGPNGAAAGVGAQHSQVFDWILELFCCLIVFICNRRQAIMLYLLVFYPGIFFEHKMNYGIKLFVVAVVFCHTYNNMLSCPKKNNTNVLNWGMLYSAKS